MNDSPERDLIAEAIALVPDPDPAKALTRLLDAAREDDITLAQTVRELMPLLAFGLLSLGKTVAEIQAKRPRGRPRKGELGDVDCFRAYQGWHIATSLNLRHLSSREVIEVGRQLEAHLRIPLQERAFPQHLDTPTLEQSVSRGKTRLGFTGPWECQRCEEIKAAP